MDGCVMKIYHGTKKEWKLKILSEGYRFDANLKSGRSFGDALYATTDKEVAKSFGEKVVKFEIDKSKIKLVEWSDLVDLKTELGKQFLKDEVNKNYFNELDKDQQEVLIGNLVRNHFTDKNIYAIMYPVIDRFTVVVYDLSLATICRK